MTKFTYKYLFYFYMWLDSNKLDESRNFIKMKEEKNINKLSSSGIYRCQVSFVWIIFNIMEKHTTL